MPVWGVPANSAWGGCYVVFDIDDQEDGTVGILAEDLVDLHIMCLEGVTGGVPADKLLLLADLRG